MHEHKEAFCLMLYRGGTAEEWVWNSRDGVTPFVIRGTDGAEMQHVEWHRDKYAPHHVPRLGSRVFVNLTVAHVLADGLLEKLAARWADPTSSIVRTYESPQAAVAGLLSATVADGRRPHLLVVDQAFLDDLQRERSARAMYRRPGRLGDGQGGASGRFA